MLFEAGQTLNGSWLVVVVLLPHGRQQQQACCPSPTIGRQTGLHSIHWHFVCACGSGSAHTHYPTPPFAAVCCGCDRHSLLVCLPGVCLMPTFCQRPHLLPI